MTSDDFFDIHF